MARVAKRRNTVLSVFILACVGAAVPASAQGPGVRGGVSVNPDQIYFGIHYETEPLVERLHFKPNLEIGFGDHVTSITGNFEFVWKFPRRGEWGFYAGGGPAFVRYSHDDVSSSDPGFNVLVGAENTRGLAFEVKIGTLESPDLKFGVGWTFK
jgi:hypothetical protein